MTDEAQDLRPLSPARALACNVSTAGIVLAAGIFLLLCGMGVIPVSVRSAACGTLLAAAGLSFVVSACIARNSVTLWLGICFLVPALVECLVQTTPYGYAQWYPLYIATPAVASLGTVWLSRAFGAHLPVFVVFGVTAALLALQSSGLLSWRFVVPLCIVYAGVLMLAYTLRKFAPETKKGK